jgi:hypothetical protein
MKDNALYLEADEDITSAIDKLQKSPADTVQIVVPKRSTLLQSIINLKLLKKAASAAGKEVVLVTGDRIAGDLAARVGLAVASSVGAKAVMNEAKPAPRPSTEDEVIDADDPVSTSAEAADAEAAASTPPAKAKRPLLKRREVSDDPAPSPLSQVSKTAAAGAAADSADADDDSSSPAKPKLKVPNYNKLQKRLLWAGLAVFLVGGYFLAMFLFASAKVTLYANATKVNIDTNFTVDPEGATNKDEAVLAGKAVTVNKDLSGPFTPTGQKDAGTKAAGTMTIYNEYDMSPHTLVAGTRFQAPDGKIFVTKADTSVPGATVGLVGGKITLSPGKSDPVPVEATANGDSYNEAPARYTIVAYTGDMQAKIYGQGAQMSGGTTKTVTVVTQPDVDAAAAALIAKDKDNAKRELERDVPDGYILLEASSTTKTVSTTPAPAVNAEATTAQVTIKVAYTGLAVKKTEYEEFLLAQETKQVGDKNQIYDDGIKTAEITAANPDRSGRQTFHFTTEAYAGTKIDTTDLTKQLAGKRYGDAMDLAARQPSVSRVEINQVPSWSSKLPGRSDKITVSIKVADVQR